MLNILSYTRSTKALWQQNQEEKLEKKEKPGPKDRKKKEYTAIKEKPLQEDRR